MRRQEQESSSSENDEDEESNEEDDQSTSSDEEIDPKMAKLFSKIEKNMKRINARIDDPIFIEDLVNTIDLIKKEKKTKNKSETRRRDKAFACMRKWVSEDKDSSSSDESFTTHSSKRSSSLRSPSCKLTCKPSHKCLVAKYIDSDVSDNESDEDSPSYDELLYLINEQKRILRK